MLMTIINNIRKIIKISKSNVDGKIIFLKSWIILTNKTY